MLERVQDRSLLGMLSLETEERLHGAAKALAQWAIVDDYDNILDLDCGDGKLLHYLSRHYSLRACGIAANPEHARQLRLKMPDAEVFHARKEDIPWRSNAFNAVFYQMKNDQQDGDFLQEVLRVLKPGGQVLISLSSMPHVLHDVASVLGLANEDSISHVQLLSWMENAGLKDVSWRLTSPVTGVAMGFKPFEEEIGA